MAWALGQRSWLQAKARRSLGALGAVCMAASLITLPFAGTQWLQLSAGNADAAVLRTRISELRAAARAAQDREEAERLKRRIAELQVLRRQSSELAELTKRYYERNYHRDERYTL